MSDKVAATFHPEDGPTPLKVLLTVAVRDKDYDNEEFVNVGSFGTTDIGMLIINDENEAVLKVYAPGAWFELDVIDRYTEVIVED